ncbi:hypothetical protein LCGC14_1301430 [marine sediment metagenome]|uniref:Uncharacterized protein n=1 Tax=marine sediment metagenome TaxID=412755 RepID=A0A0F9N616_9ZZZZ
MKKIYIVEIRDGENVYYEWTTIKPTSDYVDGFMREVKSITDENATDEEIKILEKFGVL